ncbi:xylulokinase [Uliginosibacterium sp. TH139]|uniref:xylulokinase n=1 Tax=Uliginosibacterium sp. TH139 TaxID=2067453 RepID=UPI000C79D841|nr:xylulokinase [Uliginosibacterium sp. TH139]PLK47091.1 xylulokinase [Uliginosibacterium sp. TH139]
MSCYLGIDLGTSEVKVLLLDDQHQRLATAAHPLGLSRPVPLWAEQNPADWWQACCAALDELAASYPQFMARVRGIGLSGQMHGAVLLGEGDAVLRPAILWNDGRSQAECQEMMDECPALAQIAGNLAMPGFTAPKLRWLAKHEPAVFAAIHSVLLPKDWLRLKLSGEKVSEMSDAAGTLWLDVAQRDWSDELLALCGLTRAQMPCLVEGSEVSARLLPALAARWGLPSEVLIAGGGGDNAASAVGIGAVQPGAGFLSLGTSGVLFVVNDAFRPNPQSAVHAFCHALPGRWHQMSVMLSAASCLKWVTQLTGRVDEAALLAEVAQLDVAAREAAPIFLPYLSGERTPHNDPHAQGVFFGLGFTHAGADLGWSVLEGVAFAFRDGLAALQSAGTRVAQLSLVGGGARSALWAQLLADVLQTEIVTHAGGEAGGALGAARLAWLADGGEETRVCVAPPVAERVIPAPPNASLESRYQRFRALYAALKSEFQC